jgi:hypothetical protein
MNEEIKALSNKEDLYVRRIPARMNMAGGKVMEAQTGEEDLSWLKIRIEDPKAMVVVCLRACRHSMDTDQTNQLKFNEFSEYIDQLAGLVCTSNLANEERHTFAMTCGLPITDMNMAHSAKAQWSTPE